MNFRPELAAKVMAGEKTVTRRLVSDNPRSPWYVGGCSLKKDRTYAVCPGRGKHAIGRVRIVDVWQTTLGSPGTIGDREAQREGFADEAELIEAFTAINGTYDPAARVWRIQFEAAP